MDTKPGRKNAVNKQNACYVGNLDVKVTEDILWELFLQVGRVKGVRFPKTRVPGKIFAFVEFENSEEVDYAVKILNSVQLFGKSIRVASANMSKDSQKSKNMRSMCSFQQANNHRKRICKFYKTDLSSSPSIVNFVTHT